jgi:dephospho-CoA kinase
MVAKVFTTMGIPIFDADRAAKEIMQHNDQVKSQLLEAFGASIFIEGVLQRSVLAEIVFKDPYQLEVLNAIVHPHSIAAAKSWAAKQTAPYCIKEAALIFEAGAAEGIDAIIGVSAPLSLRIHRVMQRDNISKELVEARMRNQIDQSLKMKLCDWVIVNDDQQMVIPQVVAVHQAILQS